MSFWTTSDGKSAKVDDGKFEMGGGGEIPPIPEGTRVLAIAEESNVKEWDGYEYINIKWRVSRPAEYANRVIFHKVHVYDPKPDRADRSKRMLGAIDSNAGGGLFRSMEQRGESKPSDISLSQICNRPMVLELAVWLKSRDKNGNPIPKEQQTEPGGNWVRAVSPVNTFTDQKPAANAAQQPAQQQPASPAATDFDDGDIPF